MSLLHHSHRHDSNGSYLPRGRCVVRTHPLPTCSIQWHPLSAAMQSNTPHMGWYHYSIGTSDSFLALWSSRLIRRLVSLLRLLRWQTPPRCWWYGVHVPKQWFPPWSHLLRSMAIHAQNSSCHRAEYPRSRRPSRYIGRHLRIPHRGWSGMGPSAKTRCTRYLLSQSLCYPTYAWYRPNDLADWSVYRLCLSHQQRYCTDRAHRDNNSSSARADVYRH